MFKKLKKISTVGMSREDWLDHRKKTIGGSDASAIVGLNPYASAYSLWTEKRGQLPETEDNEAMRQGRDLEKYVADRFCEETGKKVRRENSILVNPDIPFAHANIDRLVIGENAGLECKTTSSLNFKQFRNGSYPDSYYVQCMHYMAVTGADKWYLAVLVFGKQFYIFEIFRDDDEIEALMKECEKFYHCLQTGTPPPVDGTEATTNAILAGRKPHGQIELFGREKVLQEYFRQNEIKKEAELEAKRIKQQLILELDGHELGLCGNFMIRHTNQTRKTLDTKELISEYPEIEQEKYYKITQFTKFDIKEKLG